MSVATKTVRVGPITATASQTDFPYAFLVFLKTDFLVWVKLIGTTVFVPRTDFTVTGLGNELGGNIVMDSGLAESDILVALGAVPDIQPEIFTKSGLFPGPVVETSLDKIVRRLNLIEDKILGGLFIDDPEVRLAVPSLPNPIAANFLAWSNDLTKIINVIAVAIGTATSVDETDTDTTKDKMTSNNLAKRAEDVAAALKVLGGDQVDIPFIGGNVLAQHKNLIIIRPSVTTVDIDADDIILEDTDGRFFRASLVNLTATITTSGANGLDTGSEAASTWYHLWVIYNGTTVASLMSLSSTAPTLPSGYTFKGYVGAVFNDGSSDLRNMIQEGSRVFLLTAPASLIDGTAASATSIDLTPRIPTTANLVQLLIFVLSDNTTTGIKISQIFSDSAGDFGRSEVAGHVTSPVAGTSVARGQLRIGLITDQTIWYLSGVNTRTTINVTGWEF